MRLDRHPVGPAGGTSEGQSDESDRSKLPARGSSPSNTNWSRRAEVRAIMAPRRAAQLETLDVVRPTTGVKPARETLMMCTLRICRCVLLPMLIVALPHSADAQGRSHAYVSLGVGATQLDGGVDWLILNRAIGIGAEFGAGNLVVLSFNGSYHPLAHGPSRKLDPFVTVGFTTLGDLNYDARGVSVGGSHP
jgi:hypothetical protein